MIYFYLSMKKKGFVRSDKSFDVSQDLQFSLLPTLCLFCQCFVFSKEESHCTTNWNP